MKRKSEDDRCAKGGLSSRMGIARWNVEASRKLVNRTSPTPLFFVSVASKGLSHAVSLLFATLAREFISVAAKGFMGADCWRKSNCVGWKDSEEVRRTTWRAGMVRRAPSFPTGPESANRQTRGGQAEKSCRLNESIIAYWYHMSMITCKWFGCCGIALRGSLRSSGQAG